jgi:hypothetical protein
MAKKRTAVKNVASDAFDVRFAMAREINDKVLDLKSNDLINSPGGGTTIVGLRLPFPMQVLTGCSVWPLGVVVEINGPPQSCKTMFLYEIGRWFRNAGGWLDMILTEAKISETLAASLMGYDRAGQLSFWPYRARSLEHMMKLSQDSVIRANGRTEMKNPHTGKVLGDTFPVLIGVDSIMGANSDESNDKITKEGAPNRSFPVEALKLNPFMKKIAGDIQTRPYTYAIINHRKEAKPDPSKPYAPVEYTKPGGKQVTFQDTYEIVLHAMKTKTSPDTHPEGGLEVHSRVIRVENGKNSAGTNDRKFEITVSWCRRMTDVTQSDGSIVRDMKQKTTWHWNEATTDFIWSWRSTMDDSKKFNAEIRKSQLERLDSIFHLRREVGNKFWSSTLGMSKNDATNPAKVGKLINSNPDVLRPLQEAFGVEQGIEWQGGGESFSRVFNRERQAASKEFQMRIDNQVADVVSMIDEDEDF